MLKKGLVWDFAGKIFNQGVTFFVSIILARLLLPQDFALIAMIMAFFGVARVFVDFGLSQALIQFQEVKDIHYSSVFWLNLVFSTVVGLLFFFSASYIAQFYNQLELVDLIRVLSVTFVILALGAVHTAMLRKELDFKYLSKTNVTSALISGALGVLLAYKGFGVWSIVFQQISANVISLLLLWRGTKWLPQYQFSWTAVKPLWDFSKKLFLSEILNSISMQIDVFIIGRMFSPATLGFYSRGKSLNQIISTNSSSSLIAVLFPALSKIQNDMEEVRRKVISFFQLSALVSFYLGGLLYIVSEDIIVLMLGEKWISTVPYFRIMLLTTFVYPLSSIILTPIISLGRSNIFLKLEVFKKGMLVPTYIIGFQFGLTGFLYAYLVMQLLGISLNGYFSGKLIGWDLKEQWKEILYYGIPAYCGGGILFVFLSNEVVPNHFIHLILSTCIFTVYYLIYNLIFKTKASQIIINLVRPYYNKYFKR